MMTDASCRLFAVSRCMGWDDLRDMKYDVTRGLELPQIGTDMYRTSLPFSSSLTEWALEEGMNPHGNVRDHYSYINCWDGSIIDILETAMSYTTPDDLDDYYLQRMVIEYARADRVLVLIILLAYGVKFVPHRCLGITMYFKRQKDPPDVDLILLLYNFDPYDKNIQSSKRVSYETRVIRSDETSSAWGFFEYTAHGFRLTS